MTEQKEKSSKSNNGFHINVGMIIFTIIFLYIVFSVSSYFSREQIRYYEVTEGSIVRQKTYTGIAIRSEETVDAEHSGYIHFYVQEGRRASVRGNVYTVDETGDMESYLASHPELNAELTKEQIDSIRYTLSAFTQNFSDAAYQDLYMLKSNLDATAMEYNSISSAGNLDQILTELGVSFNRAKAPKAGVVSYTVDGMEGITEADVEASLFEQDGYQAKTTRSGNLVESGTPVYKLITETEWSLVFPVTEEERAKYQDMKRVQVHFLEGDESCPAELKLYTGKDNQVYGSLRFNSYVEAYASQRYLTFEIENANRVGLKIPKSSITEKEFYVVPKDFLRQSSNSTAIFIRMKQTDGKAEMEYIEPEIYRIDEQFCYLNIPANPETSTGLKTGDLLVKEDGNQTYSIGPTRSLQGVYNINKGYCIFRQIVPMEENESYVIIEENTDYGVSVYDHIVLNQALVQEGQLVYQ